MIFENFRGLGNEEFDVCIVGSGPAGISLAVELEGSGVRVLVLESGERAENRYIQSLSSAELDELRHDNMEIAVARMLGGTSNLWGARCIKFDEIDFMPRPAVVGDVTWPIEYKEIASYYEKACSYTQSGRAVYVASDNPPLQCSGEFSMHTLERWANEQKMQVIHAEVLSSSPRIDLRLRTTVVDVGFDGGGDVDHVVACNSETGERIKIKTKRLVLANGGLESTRLLLAIQRKFPRMFGGVDGPLGRYYMGHVIGEIADIVYEKQDLDRSFDFYIDSHGSYVRRRFVVADEVQESEGLLNIALWPVVPPVADPRHRSAILSMVYLGLAIGPIGRLLVAEAIRKRHVPEKPNKTLAHIWNVVKGMPAAVVFLLDFFNRRYFSDQRLPGFFILNKAHRYGLSYHSEQLPCPESRVTLSDDVDRMGLPKLRIDLRFNQKDASSIVKTHDLLDAWLRKNGLGRLEYRVEMGDREAAVLDQAKHGTHQIGTARMGSDPSNSIVDKDLRTFDCRNLFVLSSAVLPTSGQANPTLTVVALAIRLAGLLKNEMAKAVL